MSELRPVIDVTSEVRVGRIIGAACGLVACVALAGLASWALLKAYLSANPSPAPGALAQMVAPTEPLLQFAPFAELAALRAEEVRLLHSSGWVDRQGGVARIPIEQAMALLVKRSQTGRKTPP